jgi:hypothetical protein
MCGGILFCGGQAVFPVPAAGAVAATRAGSGGKTAGNVRFPPGLSPAPGGKGAVLQQGWQRRQGGVLLELLQGSESKVESEKLKVKEKRK